MGEMAPMLNVQADEQGVWVLMIMVQLVADDAIDRPRAGLEKKRSGCGRCPTMKRVAWTGWRRRQEGKRVGG